MIGQDKPAEERKRRALAVRKVIELGKDDAT